MLGRGSLIHVRFLPLNIQNLMPTAKHLLVSWIGRTDLEASAGNPKAGKGPLGQSVTKLKFDEIHLISDYGRRESDEFVKWLASLSSAPINLHMCKLSGPTEFGEIYEVVSGVLAQLTEKGGVGFELTFHLSPGTPAMAAVWIILSKTRFPGKLIESSVAAGVRTASVPFDISADFIPTLLRKPDEELERLMQGLPPSDPEFESIVHRGPLMKRVIAKARRVAPRSVPVLLEGESGTGKELFARAIHRSSPRRDGPFIVVNCGAIPTEMVEAELFGYEKGAFTGAHVSRVGYFEAANSGTLFLDEVGELPKTAQVKLLRALQENEITRLGSTQHRKVDVRIVSATNRNLNNEVRDGRFREDLFYRLAVAVLRLPPLRERSGDVGHLIDTLLRSINEESRREPGFVDKKLSAGAKNLLLQHSWPGNVRELINTLRRAVVWTPGLIIDEQDIRDALLPVPTTGVIGSHTLQDNIHEGVDLPAILGQVSASYITKALEVSGGNKTKAASLLGFASYQRLTNWMKKYGVESTGMTRANGQV